MQILIASRISKDNTVSIYDSRQYATQPMGNVHCTFASELFVSTVPQPHQDQFLKVTSLFFLFALDGLCYEDSLSAFV